MGIDVSHLKSLREDAGESLFFARELEHVLAASFDVEFPELRARDFIPVSGEAGTGAESITYTQFTKVGIAKIISDYARDIPRADVKGEKFTSPVESVAIAYGYSLQEVRAANQAGRALTTAKAEAAREGHERKVDEIAAIGDATTGLTGMLNNANVPQASAPNGDWSNVVTTHDEMLADLGTPVTNIISVTKAVESPDTQLVDPANFTVIAQKRVGDTSETVLSFHLRTNPWIRNLDHWYRLEGAGAGATDRLVTYRRMPSKLELHIPQEFESLPVQEEGLEFVINTHSRIGGTLIYKPLSVDYTDGV